MTSSTSAKPRSSDESAGSILRAQLAVEPHPNSSCAVVGTGEDVTDITHHLKVDTSECCTGEGSDSALSDCGECHTEVTFGEDADERQTYLKSAVQTHCICPIFEEHDCIPRIKTVRSGSIIVNLTVPERSVLRDVITDLRRVGATVSVEWLVNGGDADATTEIDVSTITSKQQEAMELAMELGYYEAPRNAELGDIAEELGISESAASQRLNAAETKLVTSFLEE